MGRRASKASYDVSNQALKWNYTPWNSAQLYKFAVLIPHPIKVKRHR